MTVRIPRTGSSPVMTCRSPRHWRSAAFPRAPQLGRSTQSVRTLACVRTTNPVVGNGKRRVRAGGFDAHPHLGRTCVLRRVRKRLRDNVIGGDFSRLRHPSVYASIGRPASALLLCRIACAPAGVANADTDRWPQVAGICTFRSAATALRCAQDLQLVGMRTDPDTAKLIECCCE
jgi:hypothetical protein